MAAAVIDPRPSIRVGILDQRRPDSCAAGEILAAAARM
jgi:hypothetical protein